MGSGDESVPTRRDVLKCLAVAGVAVASSVIVPDQALAAAKHRHRVAKFMVFRLSTRKTEACRACRVHHRFIVFRSFFLADANRAHPGCDCQIVRQHVSLSRFKKLFPKGSNGIAHLVRGVRARVA